MGDRGSGLTVRVRRQRSGSVEVRLDTVEVDILTDLVAQVRALLHDSTPASGDPLEDLVGIRDRTRPTDPALARLLPDTYRDDAAASGELRRLSEGDVRRAKNDASDVVIATLPPGGGKVVLSEDEVDGWLRTLTDLRLALGSRLGVDQDPHLGEGRLDPDDPRGPMLAVYGWLGELQERLVLAVMGDG